MHTMRFPKITKNRVNIFLENWKNTTLFFIFCLLLITWYHYKHLVSKFILRRSIWMGIFVPSLPGSSLAWIRWKTPLLHIKSIAFIENRLYAYHPVYRPVPFLSRPASHINSSLQHIQLLLVEVVGLSSDG